MRLNRNQAYPCTGRPLEKFHEQTQGHAMCARPVRGGLIRIEKRHRAWLRFQIDTVNQQDCVGPLLRDPAQIVFRNLLGVDHMHATKAADLLDNPAPRRIVTSASIANADHDKVASQRIEKLFSQIHTANSGDDYSFPHRLARNPLLDQLLNLTVIENRAIAAHVAVADGTVVALSNAALHHAFQG